MWHQQSMRDQAPRAQQSVPFSYTESDIITINCPSTAHMGSVLWHPVHYELPCYDCPSRTAALIVLLLPTHISPPSRDSQGVSLFFHQVRLDIVVNTEWWWILHRHRYTLSVSTQSLTGSPCHQVELKCCVSQVKAVFTLSQRTAHPRKYIPFNQGQLPTSLIITLLSEPAGLHKACRSMHDALKMRSISTVTENWNQFLKKRAYLILDSFCPVFHHQLWKVSINVNPTSKGSFDAYHKPWLIGRKLLQRYIHERNITNLITELFTPNGK